MRKLILLRGLAGSGKSTWVKEQQLEPYTLSSDIMRLLFGNYHMNSEGVRKISMEKDKLVWNTFYHILEERMKTGEFTVIDATNIKITDINRSLKLAKKYLYQVFCVDFTDIPLHIVKQQNESREWEKIVPEKVIDRMYENLQTNKLPDYIKIIKPNDFWKEISLTPVNLNFYDNVIVIGDIHGCYTCLSEHIKPLKHPNNFYIFLGDYIDRGIENVSTVNYLYHIYKNCSNVVFLEGNHDIGLSYYANGEKDKGNHYFKRYTLKEFEGVLPKRTANEFYNGLKSYFYFEFSNEKFICSHGGVSVFNEKMAICISDREFIKGSGGYEDLDTVAETFECLSQPFTQIHGHRNLNNSGFFDSTNCINLEGKVEFGGQLRCFKISQSNRKCVEYQNHCFKIQEGTTTPDKFVKRKENKK